MSHCDHDRETFVCVENIGDKIKKTGLMRDPHFPITHSITYR